MTATSQPPGVTRIENPTPAPGLTVSPQDHQEPTESMCLSESPHRSDVNQSTVRCQAYEIRDPADVMSCWLCQKGVSCSPQAEQALNVESERQQQLLQRLTELRARKSTASSSWFEALSIPTGNSFWDGLQMGLFAEQKPDTGYSVTRWRHCLPTT